MQRVVVIDESGRMKKLLKAGSTTVVAEFSDLQSMGEGEPDLNFEFDAVIISKNFFAQMMSKNNEKRRPLTDREEEVLCLKRQGRTNREVADMLCITLKTVEKHTRNIKRKLGVQSILEGIVKLKSDSYVET